MKVLGISTGTKHISIGLIETGPPVSVISDYSVSGLRSEDLTAMIDRSLKDAGIDISDIGMIAAASGPGSYSGLRGGLAAAKSFAQALSVPVREVSTLEAMAYNLADVRGTIAVVCDAVRGEVNFALFAAGTAGFKRLTDDMTVPEARIKDLLSGIKGEIHVVSSVPQDITGGPGEQMAAGSQNAVPRGVNAAIIALSKGDADLLKLAPKYSHMPNVREYKSKQVSK